MLKRIRTINKSAGLAMLARRFAEDLDARLPVVAQSKASMLKRVRTINKQEGLKILKCRKNRVSENASIQVHSTAQEAQTSS